MDAMQYLGLSLFGIIWFLLVLLWPQDSNFISGKGLQEGKSSSEEQLYKASLTKAHSGLLDADFYETARGRKHWNIKSKFAELHRKENYIFMKEVTSRFFAEKTDNVVSTTSNYGRSWMDSNIVQLEGNVLVRSAQGYVFTMNRLNYDGKSHKFRSRDLVRMKGPNPENPKMLLRGKGLIADIDIEHFRLKRNVSARKKLENSKWLYITSTSGEFYTAEDRALFYENVHSTMPKVDITGDEMELNTSEGHEFLLAKGNVVLKNRNRTGKAENAYIEIGGDEIILAGNAQIDSNENDDQIRGKRIILSTNDDRLEVEKAEGRTSQ